MKKLLLILSSLILLASCGKNNSDHSIKEEPKEAIVVASNFNNPDAGGISDLEFEVNGVNFTSSQVAYNDGKFKTPLIQFSGTNKVSNGVLINKNKLFGHIEIKVRSQIFRDYEKETEPTEKATPLTVLSGTSLDQVNNKLEATNLGLVGDYYTYTYDAIENNYYFNLSNESYYAQYIESITFTKLSVE